MSVTCVCVMRVECEDSFIKFHLVYIDIIYKYIHIYVHLYFVTDNPHFAQIRGNILNVIAPGGQKRENFVAFVVESELFNLS